MQKMYVNRLFAIMIFIVVTQIGCTPALHRAAKDDDVNKIDLLLRKGHRIDELANRFGYSPLHYAAANGSMKALEYLLEAGADINARGCADITPLHAACGLLTPLRPGDGSSEAAIYLIKNGADTSIVDGFGRTPIDYAAANGRLDVIQALLDEGVDINFSDKTTGPPLLDAFSLRLSEKECIATATYLLNHGANINGAASDGTTALHKVARGGNCDWVKFLVEHGANVNQPDYNGETPLSIINKKCPGMD